MPEDSKKKSKGKRGIYLFDEKKTGFGRSTAPHQQRRGRCQQEDKWLRCKRTVSGGNDDEKMKTADCHASDEAHHLDRGDWGGVRIDLFADESAKLALAANKGVKGGRNRDNIMGKAIKEKNLEGTWVKVRKGAKGYKKSLFLVLFESGQ